MKNGSGSEKQDMSGSSNSLESLLLQSCIQPAATQTAVNDQGGLQAQINAVLNFMQACITQARLENGPHAPEVQQTLAHFHAVQPLLQQVPTMLDLLLKAGLEINGNPFLDEDTALHAIRQFLRSGSIKTVLPDIVCDLDPDQVEIVEDLLDIDPEHDLTDDAINGGFFPAAEIHKTGSFPLSELVGPRCQADGCTEWDWVCTHSGLTRHTAGDRRIAGFVVDLNRKLPEIPPRLRPMLAEARRKGLGYLIFY